MTKFYTYVFFDPTTGIPVYVGKGSGRRWKAHYQKSSDYRLGRWIKKRQSEGHTIFPIIYDELTEDEAFTKEKELIARYGREDLRTGSLFNNSDGGDGSSGYTISDKLREIKSENMRNFWADPAKKAERAALLTGFYPSSETRAKMSASHTGKKQSPEVVAARTAKITGQKRTEEQRARMRLAAQNRKSVSL